MSLIKINNLTFSYQNNYDYIFKDVSFQIDTDWKLGFIGRNGKGKTTFLNLLLGKFEYRGQIISSVKFDYFPCDVKDKNENVAQILLRICPNAKVWELEKELFMLDVKKDILKRQFNTLSNGEQTKVLLAALFLNNNHFLLIDEPTNHLDSQARKIVSSYLNKKKGFILVSHDRLFLDGCVDHILSFNRSTIEVQAGNCSSYLQNFKNQQDLQLQQNEKLKKDIYRLKKSSLQSKTWSDKVEATKTGQGPCDRGYISHKSAKMMQRSKNIQVRQEKAMEEKAKLLKDIELDEELKISSLKYHNQKYMSLENVVPYYNQIQVCQPVSFTINEHDIVILTGKNGSGKTTLLKLINDEPIQYTGQINKGQGIIISYICQDTSHLNGSIDEFIKINNIDTTLFKTILRKLGFERIQFEKNLENYSAGQKKKVLIAKSLCEKAHIYVWDEPLNYIDLYSRLQIEKLIKQYNPTMILVEHDQAFANAVATKFVKIDN